MKTASKPAKENPGKTPAKERCRNTNCRSVGKTSAPIYRGLCHACYRALMRLIKAGKLTMQEAEERGLCKRPKAPGERRWPVEASGLATAYGRGRRMGDADLD